jgi:hypothetical protein
MGASNWWFAFRQSMPLPPRMGIAIGPFESHREAVEQRQRSKAWDCDVSEPFQAGSKQEAELRAQRSWSAPQA